MHASILKKKKWFEAQKRQKKPDAVRKKKQLFASLLPQEIRVKIWKLGKKGLESSWEGPYHFLAHILDSVDSQQTNEEGRVYITRFWWTCVGALRKKYPELGLRFLPVWNLNEFLLWGAEMTQQGGWYTCNTELGYSTVLFLKFWWHRWVIKKGDQDCWLILMAVLCYEGNSFLKWLIEEGFSWIMEGSKEGS